MRLLTVIFILALGLQLKAQAPARWVADSATGLPIPFVTIKVLHRQEGVIASADGTFRLAVAPTDTVMFSCAGYHTLRLVGSELGAKVVMAPRVRVLEAVRIHGGGQYTMITLGNGAAGIGRKISCPDTGPFAERNCWNWGPSKGEEEFAERIILPDSNASYKLNTIFVPVQKSGCWDTLVLRIYLEDTITHHPGEAIFLTPVSISRKLVKRGWLTIDVAKENIYLHHANAFFIALGWPDGAAGKNCITTILLMHSAARNTFHRSLRTLSWGWEQYGVPNAGTHYAVTLQLSR